MAHTPGPWTFDGDEIHAADCHVVCFGHDYDDYGGIQARLDNLTPILKSDDPAIVAYNAEKQANGNLIAAAPDLLDALKSSVEFIQLALGGVDFPNDAPGRFTACDDALKAVLAAIAKAEIGPQGRIG